MSLAILVPLSVLCKIAINLLLLKIIRVFDVISFSSCDTRVFQTALEGRWNLAPVGGNWKFYWEDVFTGGLGLQIFLQVNLSWGGVIFWPFEPFSKFSVLQLSVNTEYQLKKKTKEERNENQNYHDLVCTKYEMRKSMKLKQKCYRSDTASAKFLLGGPGYNMKIVIYWGELNFGGRGRGER